jgi:alpha-glucosidase (family GH31 glycosyl hydrolase)
LAQQANRTGVPVVRPTYLQYPEEQDAYASADNEYLYGPDVLVAPATTPGSTSTTSVWFPPGSEWTDYFTGKTYAGGTTQDVTTDLNSMPVFLKSGAILTTRTQNVTNDVQNPLTAVTVDVAEGASGSFSLYEDNGTTTDPGRSANTRIRYSESGTKHSVRIDPASGTFTGQVQQRRWTVDFLAATAPTTVSINGHRVSAAGWQWNGKSGVLTVEAPAQSVHQKLDISYR